MRYDLETREATSTDRAEHSTSSARSRTITEKAASKGVNIGKHQQTNKCSSIVDRRVSDPIDRESLSYERPSRKDCEVWDHIATTQTNTDSKYRCTGRKAKLCGVPGGSQTSTNRDALQMSNRGQSALWPLSGQVNFSR